MGEFFALAALVAIWSAAVFVVVALAFLPTIVAWRRKHPDLLWIFILNFGLGGTCIGWILALVWAFRDDWLLSNFKSDKSRWVSSDDENAESRWVK